jgi:hypothetical protein
MERKIQQMNIYASIYDCGNESKILWNGFQLLNHYSMTPKSIVKYKAEQKIRTGIAFVSSILSPTINHADTHSNIVVQW